MIGRIIEVADDQRHLSLLRGFMLVHDTEGAWREIGRIPLDDIQAVIANAHGLSYSNNLLIALAERCAPVVLCSNNHNAAGIVWPVEGNYQQAKRFDAQIAATQPTIKRLWAELVKAKLQQQASALNVVQANNLPITSLIKKVRSGDPENIEAQAARRYWSALFGADFRRDQQVNGINAMLNYGYTVLRACTARAVIAAGLHPTLGLHHSNQNNAMRLVDDLMEPFRPMVDLKVWYLQRMGLCEVNPESKRALVNVMFDDMHTASGMSPVCVCIQKLATSLVQIFLGDREKLDLPLSGLPLDLQQVFDKT